ncbi:hypothetical protein [uncultured Alteromonas sp.]|uniref:hypothetical protein n=1 Tax=uncultured Alteromonas sp. TaxID=179113 RepID=UPI0030ECDB02|tara:strand:- start:1139 stop:1339 length:201 start_codon:yes stop_codon:yes gene_type:complete
MPSKKEQKQRILKRVQEWAGDSHNALAWYESERIASFGCTPSQAVEGGHYEALMAYLDAIEIGGFA